MWITGLLWGTLTHGLLMQSSFPCTCKNTGMVQWASSSGGFNWKQLCPPQGSPSPFSQGSPCSSHWQQLHMLYFWKETSINKFTVDLLQTNTVCSKRLRFMVQHTDWLNLEERPSFQQSWHISIHKITDEDRRKCLNRNGLKKKMQSRMLSFFFFVMLPKLAEKLWICDITINFSFPHVDNHYILYFACSYLKFYLCCSFWSL